MKDSKDLSEARELWKELGDVPVNDDEEIDEPWNGFEKGTEIYYIWHWFEETYNCSIVEDLQRFKKYKEF